jgi:hypothetical protein
MLVGPDNGLLVPSAERFGGVVGAWELTESAYQLQPLSRTFHGRDVFAPAAAHLATGLEPAALGPALDPAALVRLDVPVPEVGKSEIVAHVLIIDRFGNVQLDVTAAQIERFGIVPGTRVELEIGLGRVYAVAARTFADVGRGDIVLYEDSYRNIAIAINEGDAASVVSARAGDVVRIRVRG